MNKYHTIAIFLSMVGLVFVTSVAGGPRAAMAQSSSATDVVKALATAMKSHDETQVRALLAPGFQDLEDPGSPGSGVVDLDGFVREVIDQRIVVTYTSLKQTDERTVVVDDVLDFTAPDGLHLPHPFTETSTFTVVNGQITVLSEILSPQTRQELAALEAQPAPGMPTTGAPDTWGALAIFLAGLA